MHFTYIFNIFVFMQIFNFLNARKLNDELNIFEGLRRSKMFVVIVIMIIILQVLMVTFGYRVVNVAFWGLQWKGWIITILISSMGLVVSFLLKLIPMMIKGTIALICPKDTNKDMYRSSTYQIEEGEDELSGESEEGEEEEGDEDYEYQEGDEENEDYQEEDLEIGGDEEEFIEQENPDSPEIRKFIPTHGHGHDNQKKGDVFNE